MAIQEGTEIEVISDDDETLKTLGELLSNKTSRDLLKFLMNKETYKMKISDELGVPFSLVEHHLKKMEKLGLVKISQKKLVKDGVLHKTYKITATGIFIFLNNTETAIKENGTLKKIFKDGIKLVAIGGGALFSLISLNYNPNEISRLTPDVTNVNFFTDKIPLDVTYFSLAIATIIVSVGLFLFFKKKRN